MHDRPGRTSSHVGSADKSPRHRVLVPNDAQKMSLPRSSYDPRRVCINPFPEFSLGPHKRTAGIYIAGALVRCFLPIIPSTTAARTDSPSLNRMIRGQFAIANWTFIDAAVRSAHAVPSWGGPAPVHVTFIDWVPGISTLLGMLVVSLIDKDRVRPGDSVYADGSSSAVWRARLFLFIGFALMAGGLAGSVVSVYS